MTNAMTKYTAACTVGCQSLKCQNYLSFCPFFFPCTLLLGLYLTEAFVMLYVAVKFFYTWFVVVMIGLSICAVLAFLVALNHDCSLSL